MHTSKKDITKAQQWLQNTGSKIRVSGEMTIGMKTALYSYQRKRGLPETGELDKTTWKALKKENSRWRKFWRK